MRLIGNDRVCPTAAQPRVSRGNLLTAPDCPLFLPALASPIAVLAPVKREADP